MKINPKKIARMITEDPNEVVPSDHFDDTEDEYMDPNACDVCGVADADEDHLHCDLCDNGEYQICLGCAYRYGRSSLEKIGAYDDYSWYIPHDGGPVSCVCPSCIDVNYDR